MMLFAGDLVICEHRGSSRAEVNLQLNRRRETFESHVRPTTSKHMKIRAQAMHAQENTKLFIFSKT